MTSENTQHRVGRVRPPRVQITCDPHTGGAMEQKELPFVVGVMAGLTGHAEEPLPKLAERRFVPIDRDNFNQVLAKAKPRLALKVANRLTDEDAKLAIELRFRHLSDFEPAQIAEQVPPLRELLKLRRQLTQLLGKMEGNDRLERLLAEVLEQTVNVRTETKLLADGETVSATDTPPPEEAR